MKPPSIMVIAGEASGDLLAAELVKALGAELARPYYSADTQPLRTSLAPRFFGAGGPRMAEAGVELAVDMTRHSVIGLWEALRHYSKFRQIFNQLFALAVERRPDAIVCVDFSGFNRRFAAAVKNHVRNRRRVFNNWNPRIIQYVSPQVWASRADRAYQVARDFDLLLSIFPFEKEWYARRVPRLRVEFVGHPMLDRHACLTAATEPDPSAEAQPRLLLLPGSRAGELERHLPVMLAALREIQETLPGARSRMVLPNETLAQQARSHSPPASLELRIGGLSESLGWATAAIASTGTVTMECACFGVPTVAIYKTSWSTYQIAKRIIKVKHLAMPNLLAGETVYPEFIQHEATPGNISRAALEFLQVPARRNQVKTRLGEIVSRLGGPGASARAAREIAGLLAR